MPAQAMSMHVVADAEVPCAGGPSNRQVAEQQERWQESPAGRAMQQQRQRLPACKARPDVLRAVAQNQVVVISGETGGHPHLHEPPQHIMPGLGQQSPVTLPKAIRLIFLAAQIAGWMARS